MTSSRYTNAPAKRRDTPDKSVTLLIRYLRGGVDTSSGMWPVRGAIKSASGPERRRESVLEIDIRRTWVAVTVSMEDGRDMMPDTGSGYRERVIVPIFEMIISHCK